MKDFYSRLSYSFGNEDGRCEQKALAIQPEDQVVCITASGDRPLNLLTEPLENIIAVDMNPFQNALVDLKRHALDLDYTDYLAFMGALPSEKRLATYQKLRSQLTEESRALWDRHTQILSRGVLYQGAIERLLRHISKWVCFLQGERTIRELLEIEDLEEQRCFLADRWPYRVWRCALRLVSHPLVAKYVINDPCFSGDHATDYLYECMHGYMERRLVRDSPLLNLMLGGSVPPRIFPPYLQEEDVMRIRQQVGRLQMKTTNMITFLEEGESQRFDCFSISDIASYMNASQFARLLHAIVWAAKPGARFVLRQSLVQHTIPADLADHFQRNHPLEEQLAEEDGWLVYRFIAGTMH